MPALWAEIVVLAELLLPRKLTENRIDSVGARYLFIGANRAGF